MAARGGKSNKQTTYLGKPKNKKYEHVKSVIDTGASVSNYMEKIEEIRKNYRFRKDEIFKRMKISTFAQLVLQVAEVVNLEMEREDLDDESISGENNLDSARTIDTSRNGGGTDRSRDGGGTDRSCLLDVISGVGELSTSQNNNNKDEKEEMFVPDPLSLPFLLLDIRDNDAFETSHLIGAISYPSAMLNRTVNYLSKEICAFKNKPGKIIVVYDDDEKLAPSVATSLIQKEVDNVIMLSGGMRVLHKKFPGCFIAGTVPPTCFSPKFDRKGKLKTPPVITGNVGMEWYTSELLEKIQDLLDDVLLSNESSRMSSRSSRSSKATSRASTVTNR